MFLKTVFNLMIYAESTKKPHCSPYLPMIEIPMRTTYTIKIAVKGKYKNFNC